MTSGLSRAENACGTLTVTNLAAIAIHHHMGRSARRPTTLGVGRVRSQRSPGALSQGAPATAVDRGIDARCAALVSTAWRAQAQ